MPDVSIQIGGRSFEVACQDGEEHYLRTAAALLDAEAETLASQIGRLPEARMLLMAGLMLADRTAALEDQLREAREQLAAREAELAEVRARPQPEPVRIEVPVIPPGVTDSLADIAARSEALAAQMEERLKAG